MLPRCVVLLLLLASVLSAEMLNLTGGSAQLVSCRPVTTRPCMRLSVPLPEGADATFSTLSLRIRFEDVTLTPFHVRQNAVGLEVTFAVPYKDLSSLLGYSVDLRLLGTLSDGRQFESSVVSWESGGLLIAYEDECNTEERARAPREVDTVAVVRPLMVALGSLAILCVFWFLVPLWIWGEEPPPIQPLRKRRMGA